jgi:hypothetical protein
LVAIVELDGLRRLVDHPNEMLATRSFYAGNQGLDVAFLTDGREQVVSREQFDIRDEEIVA